MKRRIATGMLVTVFAVGLVVSVPARAQVGSSACSLARAAGTYGVSDSGTVIGVGPRAAVGLLALDAAGNIKATVTVNLNGGVTESTLSGTYQVNANCTGTTTFTELGPSGTITAEVALVWDANMQELRFLFTSVVLPDGTQLITVINGSARKLVP
jgi:hypothetical protein